MRFPVQHGDSPSSTLGESRTILVALIHAARRLPKAWQQRIHILTDSKSSTQGNTRIDNNTTARAYLSNKFSTQWDLIQHIIHDLISDYDAGSVPITWIPTEHGRPLFDPDRYTPWVLLHRVADAAANVATAHGRDNESNYLRMFSPPTMLDHPIAVERAGTIHPDPTTEIHNALTSQCAARLVDARSTSALGPTHMANHAAHPSATSLLVSSTPGLHMDAGRRDMLGRTHTNAASIRDTMPGLDAKKRLDKALTGSDDTRETACLLCGSTDGDTVGDRAHFWVCPCLEPQRRARLKAMANAVAAHGVTMHHAPGLRHHEADRSAINRQLLSLGDKQEATVVLHNDTDGEPYRATIDMVEICDDDTGAPLAVLRADRARAILAQLPRHTRHHRAKQELVAAITHPIIQPQRSKGTRTRRTASCPFTEASTSQLAETNAS